MTKRRELILYVFFGGLTTVVSFLTYILFTRVGFMGVVPANILSWIISVTFAYLTNRKWVFCSKKSGAREIAGEVTTFFASRVFSGLLETAIMFVFVDILSLYDVAVKIAATVIVVVLNYVLSKVIVFKTNH